MTSVLSSAGPSIVLAPEALTIRLDKDVFTLYWRGEAVPLSQKWVVYYTLLALHGDRHVATDEICDHHPWSRLKPDVAGRDMWRFTQTQERRYFGTRITSSPARQASKLFTLALEPGQELRFEPNRPAVADHLRSLRSQRNTWDMELGECTLLIYSGLVEHALGRLLDLRSQSLDVNERAHLETLITLGLDEQGGAPATAPQLPVLYDLLGQAGLSRLNRARILIRLARHHTRSSDFAAAQTHYGELRGLLVPEDGVEYCWYHIHYGLFLSRMGKLDQAMHHQRVAHDAAQVAQWWHGVHAARSNLARIHLSLAEQGPLLSRRSHRERALEWALSANTTATLTRQPVALARTSVMVAQSYRLLEQWSQARHWLDAARRSPELAHRPELLAAVHDELALLEECCGNLFLADVARTQAGQNRRRRR